MEVWAAGVTYKRSANARADESGADESKQDVYTRVYSAERPELFSKGPAWKTVGHRSKLNMRPDSRWCTSEPEYTVVFDNMGRIIGYTIGNDASARDIEGENPLYLPQAKVFDDCCAMGPGLKVAKEVSPPETEIEMEIARGGEVIFNGTTKLEQLNRTPSDLASWLFRYNSFPYGVALLTGTGIVPPGSLEHFKRTLDGEEFEPDEFFTHENGDVVRIRIGELVLENTVSKPSRG